MVTSSEYAYSSYHFELLAESNDTLVDNAHLLTIKTELLRLHSVQCLNEINIINGYIGRIEERKGL